MAYEDDEALAPDEKVAMEILAKEFDWYTDVRRYMDNTFKWYELDEDDRRLFLDAMYALGKPRDMLVHLMDSVEIHHKDFSTHKSVINEQRADLYNDFFEISHKAFDPALKDYLASFHTNSLPFPDSDSDSKEEDKDGETSPQSENSNITSKTEPEMITRKRKRSPDEAEEQEESVGSGVIHPPLPQLEMITKNRKTSPDEAEEEESVGSGYIYNPLPPLVFEDGYFPGDYDMYHDHSKCDLNYRMDDDDVDYYFDF